MSEDRLSPPKLGRFPLLREEGYKVTSPHTRGKLGRDNYNCVAFAADDTSQVWDPYEPFGYWPEGVPRETSLDSYIKVFETLGYKVCDNGEVEARHEKIALYEKNGVFSHVAKQLQDGRWKSKLGGIEDIEHNTLRALESVDGIGYGEVKIFMKKPIPEEAR